jgi:hypothetical protein
MLGTFWDVITAERRSLTTGRYWISIEILKQSVRVRIHYGGRTVEYLIHSLLRGGNRLSISKGKTNSQLKTQVTLAMKRLRDRIK